VGALLAVSCSDDDSGGQSADTTTPATGDDTELPEDAQPYIDAVRDDTMNPEEAGDMALPEEEATCMAERAVAVVGMDAITESGATPQEFAEANQLSEIGIDLSDEQVEQFEHVLRDCLPAATLEDAFATALGVPDSNACDGAFDSDSFFRSSALSLRASDDAADEAIAEFFDEIPDACAELALLGGVGESLAVDRDCLADELDDSVSHNALVASVEHGNDWTTEEPELFATVEAAIEACQATG
jgi:hypothetical protein